MKGTGFEWGHSQFFREDIGIVVHKKWTWFWSSLTTSLAFCREVFCRLLTTATKITFFLSVAGFADISDVDWSALGQVRSVGENGFSLETPSFCSVTQSFSFGTKLKTAKGILGWLKRWRNSWNSVTLLGRLTWTDGRMQLTEFTGFSANDMSTITGRWELRIKPV